jgi:AcrR family transcriptional regulator
VDAVPRGEFDRSARKAQTRSRLLEAAARVYARRGFNGATLDEVASEAGLSKGAVYAHFGSKENLLVALMEEYLAAQISEQIGLFDQGRALAERPLAGSEHWMEGLEENPDRFRLLMELWAHGQRDERLRQSLARGFDALRATLASFASDSAAADGFELPAGGAEQLANITMGLGLGLALLKLTEPEALPSALFGTVLSILTQAPPEDRERIAALAAQHAGTPAAS